MIGFARGRARGQATIFGIIMTAVSLAVLVAMLPVVDEFIAIGVNSTNATGVQALLQLVPILMVSGLIVGALIYFLPRQ